MEELGRRRLRQFRKLRKSIKAQDLAFLSFRRIQSMFIIF